MNIGIRSLTSNDSGLKAVDFRFLTFFSRRIECFQSMKPGCQSAIFLNFIFAKLSYFLSYTFQIKHSKDLFCYCLYFHILQGLSRFLSKVILFVGAASVSCKVYSTLLSPSRFVPVFHVSCSVYSLSSISKNFFRCKKNYIQLQMPTNLRVSEYY